MDLDEEAAPAGDVGTVDLDDAGGGAAAAEHPGGQPALDLGGQMTDGIAGLDVHPDLRIVDERRIGDEEQLIAILDAVDDRGALAEDGAVDRGPEMRRVVLR